MQRHDALAVALKLHQMPALAATAYLRSLPKGMTAVLRLAARLDEAELQHTAAGLGVEPDQLHAASVEFLRHALFDAKADDYRVLGLTPGATPKQIQEHKRLLLSWLHPDRNTKRWEQPLFRRVGEAAARLQAAPASKPEPIAVPTVNGETSRPAARPPARRLGPARGWVIAGARERRPQASSWRRRLAIASLSFAFVIFVFAALLASLDLQASNRLLQMAWSATPQLFDW
jgi:hypothetical protein